MQDFEVYIYQKMPGNYILEVAYFEIKAITLELAEDMANSMMDQLLQKNPDMYLLVF